MDEGMVVLINSRPAIFRDDETRGQEETMDALARIRKLLVVVESFGFTPERGKCMDEL